MIDTILGKKLEITIRFDKNGKVLPATLILAGPCIIAEKRTNDKDGYNAAIIGYLKAKKTSKSKTGQFKNLPFIPGQLKEVKIDNLEDLNIGDEIGVDIFEAGDLVKVTGVSKGKGFAGVVKRWGFAGGPKTHGQSDRHRAPGSIGAGTTPGRVLKGKKMAGRMGNETVTVSNLKILEVDPQKNLLLVSGSVPGSRNSTLMIKKIAKDKKFAGLYQGEDDSEHDVSVLESQEQQNQIENNLQETKVQDS
jgi:large subunit ribosomal protein L3